MNYTMQAIYMKPQLLIIMLPEKELCLILL